MSQRRRSGTEKNMEEQDPLAKKVMGKLMRNRGSTHAKKEWIDAMRGRWGLMDSGWYEDETCRLCSDCPTCAHPELQEMGWERGCPECIESLQHVVQVGCTRELRRLRRANMDELVGELNSGNDFAAFVRVMRKRFKALC